MDISRQTYLAGLLPSRSLPSGLGEITSMNGDNLSDG
jgi:hypothetical protein